MADICTYALLFICICMHNLILILVMLCLLPADYECSYAAVCLVVKDYSLANINLT